jgi:hypothetical protein
MYSLIQFAEKPNIMASLCNLRIYTILFCQYYPQLTLDHVDIVYGSSHVFRKEKEKAAASRNGGQRKMPRIQNRVPGENGQDLTLSNEPSITREEVQRLLALTVELLSQCARVSGRVDPAIGAMVAYARDELLEGAIKERNERA